MVYSSLAVQKTTAALVTSVTCSFYPSMTIESLECDEEGFDLLFLSEIELNAPILQVLQEEIRRRKSSVSLRSFSMMSGVVQAYAKDKHKQIGPISFLRDRALLDVCEVDSLCCLIEGPHEEDRTQLAEIVLTAFSCQKKGRKYEWHIRGCSVPHKKEARESRLLQQRAWESHYRILFEKEHLAVFCDNNILWLPEGVRQCQKIEKALSLESDDRIQASFLHFPHVSSDIELLLKLLERKSLLQKSVSFENTVMERIESARQALFRIPCGSLPIQTILTRYCFHLRTTMEQEVRVLLQQFQTLGFSCRLKLFSKSQTLSEEIQKFIRVFVPETMSIDVGEEVRELKENVCLLFYSEHVDGRRIPLAACVVDARTRKSLLSVPALSLERWLGFSLEISRCKE